MDKTNHVQKKYIWLPNSGCGFINSRAKHLYSLHLGKLPWLATAFTSTDDSCQTVGRFQNSFYIRMFSLTQAATGSTPKPVRISARLVGAPRSLFFSRCSINSVYSLWKQFIRMLFATTQNRFISCSPKQTNLFAKIICCQFCFTVGHLYQNAAVFLFLLQWRPHNNNENLFELRWCVDILRGWKRSSGCSS